MDVETNTYQRFVRSWEIAVKHRWAIFIASVVSLILAFFYSLLTVPLYRSTATIMIERRSPDILNIQDFSRVDYSMTAYMDFFESQHQILRSDAIARKAGERLNLSEHPYYEKRSSGGRGIRAFARKLRKMLPSFSAGRGALPPSPEEIAMNRVKEGLQIIPSRTSQLVAIQYTSPDPEIAATIANAVADAYIAYTLESNFTTSDQAADFLIAQIQSLKKEIAAAEETLQRYGENKGILSVDDSNNITLQALSSIAAQQTKSRTLLAEKKAALNAVTAADPHALPQVQESPLLVHLKEEIVQVEAEITRLSGRFHPDWPERVALESKRKQLQKRLEEETASLAESVRAAAASEYQEAEEQVRNMENLLRRQESDAQMLRRDAIRYSSLQTEIDKKTETLRSLLERQDEMSLSSKLKEMDATSTNVRIVDKARPARAPFRPDMFKNLLFGMLAGLSLGLGLAFLMDFMDNTVETAQDLEKLTSLPVMASIPDTRGGKPSSGLPPAGQGPAGVQPAIDLICSTDARSPVSEAYRELRTSILLSASGRPPRSIMVTSALPGEGKSSTVLNIAVVLAQLRKKVLVIDSDLRRPRLHLALDRNNRKGLSTFLSGIEPEVRQLIQTTGVEGLDFLPSGPIPPNPSELLNGAGFDALLQGLEQSGYDHILFDAPPVMAVADPIILANQADAAILIVLAGSTSKQAIQHSLEKFRKSGIRPIGAVLNKVGAGSREYGRYTYRYQEDSRKAGGA